MNVDFLLERTLAGNLDLSVHQVRLLLALKDCPAMDYRISDTLHLFPRSKMRNRVLDPLHRSGWILIHSLPSTGDTGASRVAWSLNTQRAAELAESIAAAEQHIATVSEQARRSSRQLFEELFG